MEMVINDIIRYIDQGHTDITLEDITTRAHEEILLSSLNKKLIEHGKTPSITKGLAYNAINRKLCTVLNNQQTKTTYNNPLFHIIASHIQSNM